MTHYDDDMMAFLEQNELTARTLTDEQKAAVEPYAEHHSGGLFVLGTYVGPRYAKCHDSWGDEESVVVHIYNPESPDDPMERVIHFTTGTAAVQYFLTLEEDPELTTEERQRQRYQAAVDAFADTAQYPPVRVVETDGMVWMECAQGHHWGSVKPEDGCPMCRKDHKFRAMGRPECIEEGCHNVVTCSDRAWAAGIRKCEMHHEEQMASQYHSGPVCLDEYVTVMAQYSDRRWNGWVCPSLDAWAVERVMSVLGPPDESYYKHDWREDGALLLSQYDGEIVEEDEEMNFDTEVMLPDEDGLYPLGAFGWTWSEDEPCGVLVNELPCVRYPEHEGEHDPLENNPEDVAEAAARQKVGMDAHNAVVRAGADAGEDPNDYVKRAQAASEAALAEYDNNHRS